MGHKVGNNGNGQGEVPTFVLCPIRRTTGGQGASRETGSEGLAENHRVVVDRKTNRSAKDGGRSSLHYGGEGIWLLSIVPRCVRTTR